MPSMENGMKLSAVATIRTNFPKVRDAELGQHLCFSRSMYRAVTTVSKGPEGPGSPKLIEAGNED